MHTWSSIYYNRKLSINSIIDKQYSWFCVRKLIIKRFRVIYISFFLSLYRTLLDIFDLYIYNWADCSIDNKKFFRYFVVATQLFSKRKKKKCNMYIRFQEATTASQYFANFSVVLIKFFNFSWCCWNSMFLTKNLTSRTSLVSNSYSIRLWNMYISSSSTFT